MRITLNIIGLSLLLLLISCQSVGHTKKTDEEQRAALKEKIDSRVYTIEVDKVLPSGGKMITPTTIYSLTIDTDSVNSYLPYFGRAYSIPYGGGEGLRFQSLIKDYSVTYNKKGKAKISFSTQTKEDLFDFIIEVFPGGSASIRVASVNRQMISYSGSLIDIYSKEEAIKSGK